MQLFASINYWLQPSQLKQNQWHFFCTMLVRHFIWHQSVHTSHSTPFSVTLTGFLHTPQLSFASGTISTVEVVTSSLETLLPLVDPVFFHNTASSLCCFTFLLLPVWYTLSAMLVPVQHKQLGNFSIDLL